MNKVKCEHDIPVMQCIPCGSEARLALEAEELDVETLNTTTCVNPVCREAYAVLNERTERLNMLVALMEVWCERNGGRVTVKMEEEHKPIFDRGMGLAVQTTQEKGQFVVRLKLVEDPNVQRHSRDGKGNDGEAPDENETCVDPCSGGRADGDIDAVLEGEVVSDEKS